MRLRKKIFRSLAVTFLTLIGALASASPTLAEPILGEVRWFGFTFCPRGWSEANGQLLSIPSNEALFSLFGTTYGGDGRTTFALPDLRGRVMIHTGQGAGLSNRALGSRGGSENNALNEANLPAHSHSIVVSADPASKTDPSGASLAASGSYRSTTSNSTTLKSNSISNTGSGSPVNNMQPYLTLRACVAMVGTYPSRD